MYGYDQINRISSMTGYDWEASATPQSALSGYSSSYTYDANGNIKTLKRHAVDAAGVS